MIRMNRAWFAPLLFAANLLACLASASASEPHAAIKGPTAVPSGSAVLLDATSSVADYPLVWRVQSGPDTFSVSFDKSGRASVAFFLPAAPDGIYTISLAALGKPADPLGAPLVDVAVHVVTVGSGGPAPQPGPVPGPAPGPVPAPVPAAIAKPIHVSYVFDPASPVGSDGRTRLYFVSTKWESLNAVFRAYQASGTDGRPDLAAKLAGLPGVVIQDDTGRVLRTFDAGSDPAAAPSDVVAYVGSLVSKAGK